MHHEPPVSRARQGSWVVGAVAAILTEADAPVGGGAAGQLPLVEGGARGGGEAAELDGHRLMMWHTITPIESRWTVLQWSAGSPV